MPEPFLCRIENKIANPVRVGAFGFDDAPPFRGDLQGGQTADFGPVLFSGPQVIVVWDTLSTPKVVVTAGEDIEEDTFIHIFPTKITFSSIGIPP